MVEKQKRFDRRTLLVAGVGGVGALAAGAVSLPRGPAWRRVFFDDFTGTSLDRDRWFRYSGPGTAGIGRRDPRHVEVGDGELRIVGSGHVSGGVGQRSSRLYGRWEVRARVDRGNGYGPAILLWPQSDRWPEHGEIDIAEIPRGARAESHFTVHWGAANEQRGVSSVADFARWHVFGCEWEPGAIRYLLDGAVRWELTAPAAAIPSRPMFLGIQLDVGADGHWITARDAATPERVVLHVDWVAGYAR